MTLLTGTLVLFEASHIRQLWSRSGFSGIRSAQVYLPVTQTSFASIIVGVAHG